MYVFKGYKCNKRQGKGEIKNYQSMVNDKNVTLKKKTNKHAGNSRIE